MEYGYLEVILGPMFAGKTTRIIEQYNKNPNESIAINYSGDTRYGSNVISTHDGKKIDCISMNELSPLKNSKELTSANIILINEGQFFTDLQDFVKFILDTTTKSIYVCGLDGDFNQNKFGYILDIIPLADKVTKLTGNCNNCDGASLFSHRISNEEGQVVIGSNNYIPLCRKCYRNRFDIEKNN
tara:strand:- start:2974 stop:3528 length:555 start_codon:yes stop_codon:yes gene_type:complete